MFNIQIEYKMSLFKTSNEFAGEKKDFQGASVKSYETLGAVVIVGTLWSKRA